MLLIIMADGIHTSLDQNATQLALVDAAANNLLVFGFSIVPDVGNRGSSEST